MNYKKYNCKLLLTIALLFFTSTQQVFSQEYIEIIKNAGTKDFDELVELIDAYYEEHGKGDGPEFSKYQAWKHFNRPGASISFWDLSEGNFTSYEWYINDSLASFNNNLSYQFNDPEDHNIKFAQRQRGAQMK